LAISGVLHNPTKDLNGTNTLIGVFYKMLWAKSFSAQAIGGVMFMARRMELNGNTLVWYCKNALGSITYLSTLCGVLHNPTKTWMEINTPIGVFCKTPWVKSFYI
jgi:hypothetical protein